MRYVARVKQGPCGAVVFGSRYWPGDVIAESDQLEQVQPCWGPSNNVEIVDTQSGDVIWPQPPGADVPPAAAAPASPPPVPVEAPAPEPPPPAAEPVDSPELDTVDEPAAQQDAPPSPLTSRRGGRRRR
jgi:hypothetical protein